MQVTREDLNPCTVRLTIVCPEELVREGYARAYKEAAKEIRVPGFRPGQAPRAVVEQLVNPDKIRDAAIDIVMNRAYRAALKEQALEPYAQPSVDKAEIEEDPPKCEFSIKVPLKPVVNLADYKGIAVVRPRVEVSEEDIAKQIEALRSSKATREQVTGRTVQDGDIAVVNIKVEGEEGDGRNFMSVVGQTFEGLDEELRNMGAEEVKATELSFPETFQEKDWAGKTLKCKLTLRSLSAVKSPELDDEFAQSLQFESVEELERRVREFLTDTRVGMAQDYVNEQLMAEIVRTSEIHVPITMVETVAAQQLRDIAEAEAQSKRTLEDYAQAKGMTVEELREALLEESKVQVERAVIAQEIFQREALKLTNDDFNKELFDMAREYRVTPDEMVAMLKRNDALGELRNRALYRKVAEFLTQNAKIEEVEAPASA